MEHAKSWVYLKIAKTVLKFYQNIQEVQLHLGCIPGYLSHSLKISGDSKRINHLDSLF